MLQTAEACTEAIESTQSFLRTLLASVQAAVDAGEPLRQAYERAERAMTPLFGDWPVYQHVLPFDVARAYDELSGIEHPRIWTAERDKQLWQTLKA